MKYRLAIFDFDGTLADTLPWMSTVYNEVAKECGFRQLAAHEFEKCRHLHGSTLLRELQIPLWKLPQAMNGMRRKMAQNTAALSLFPGIHEALATLAASGINIAICSSNARENIETILGPSNTKLITHYACGVSMFGKAGRLKRVLKDCDVAAADAVYIGDEIRDAEAAAQSGVRFCAVTWGMHSEGALREQKPAEIFQSVKEIADKLCS